MNLRVIRPFVLDGKPLKVGDLLEGLPAATYVRLLSDAPDFVERITEIRTLEGPPQDRMLRKGRKRSSK